MKKILNQNDTNYIGTKYFKTLTEEIVKKKITETVEKYV